MSRQFIACAFKEGGRQYTYHNDGAPLSIGDRVRVSVRHGGEQIVKVLEVWSDAPSFETKPIIGLAEPELEPAQKQFFDKEQ